MCWANTWVGKQTGSRMWPQEALVFEMVNTHMDIGMHECMHADTHRKKVQKKEPMRGADAKVIFIYLGQMQEILLTCNFACV